MMEKQVNRYSICLVNSGETAYFVVGISAKNISFPFANWSGVPHGCQLVVCLIESFMP